MKTTNEGAQMAIEVVDSLCARNTPNNVAYVDELLLGWSKLSVGRSAIARALSQEGGAWALRDVTRYRPTSDGLGGVGP